MSMLVLAVLLTLGISSLCSILEAIILSISTSEVEALRKKHPRLGAMLERFQTRIEETSSAILSLNTIAHTAGAAWVGILAATQIPGHEGLVMAIMVVAILLLSEILPKNLGFTYRRFLAPYIVYPLQLVRISMWPLAYLARHSVSVFVRETEYTEEEQEQEIILLAEKRAQEGSLTPSERDMISNALSLDNIRVSEIMTPRTVVSFVPEDTTVGETSRDYKNIPFARMPVYKDNIDKIVGLVRRRDILQAASEDKFEQTMKDLMADIVFIPDTASALNALQLFLQKHQQLALVVDEYGSTAGVITIEDVVEHLLGKEIYEDSDVAVDMRELARRQAESAPAPAPSESTSFLSTPYYLRKG